MLQSAWGGSQPTTPPLWTTTGGWASSKSTAAMVTRFLLVQDDRYEIVKHFTNRTQDSSCPLRKVRALFLMLPYGWEDGSQLCQRALVEGAGAESNPGACSAFGMTLVCAATSRSRAGRQCLSASALVLWNLSSPAASDPDFTPPFSTWLQLDLR